MEGPLVRFDTEAKYTVSLSLKSDGCIWFEAERDGCSAFAVRIPKSQWFFVMAEFDRQMCSALGHEHFHHLKGS